MVRKVAVIMGSDSDWPVVKGACAQLKALDIPFEAHILSAHRTPAEAADFAKNARANGFGVILCAAGMAAHLAGAFAANTTLPVIGIPMKGGAMDGLDALLATVQMPSGIPVATVALNGAKNAAYLAVAILAVADDELAAKLDQFRADTAAAIAKKDAAIAACEELLGRETGDVCTYRRLRIRTGMLRRGLRLYRLAQEKYLGAMLAAGKEPDADGTGRWADAGGMYIPLRVMEGILDRIDSEELASTAEVCGALKKAHERYGEYAAGWAFHRLEELLGHRPTAVDIEAAIEAGTAAAAKLAAMAADDMRSEQEASMAIGYGIDAPDDEGRMADFRAVRGIR